MRVSIEKGHVERHQRARFAARKAIREDLIEDLIVNPLRASVRVIDGKLLQPRRRKTAKSLRGKPQLAVIPEQLKAIASARLAAAQVDVCPPCRYARLRLAALFNELAAAEVVRRSGDCALGLLEIEGKRFALSHDFLCRSLAPLKDNRGFTAALFCEPVQLEATFSAWIDEDLHLSLGVVNRGQRPLDFKLAFPHLAGLAVSENPADDYYFFPWGGGIIADAPAIVRRGYGDHEAIYQVMDLFSPARGAGLAVWTADADGRHKVLALRKHVPGQSEINGDMARTPTAAEYRWTKSLGPVPGLSLTYEYLRRTRQPGESFVAHEAQLRAHAGDWHAAMQAYSDWCRRHWQFRPYPSRLGSVHSMIARGWGQDVLFRDGKYREDVVQPRSDCVELMSWWEWSPLGPWGTPIDQVEKKLGLAKYKQWDSYFAKDPVTGKLMFNTNPAGSLNVFRQLTP